MKTTATQTSDSKETTILLHCGQPAALQELAALHRDVPGPYSFPTPSPNNSSAAAIPHRLIYSFSGSGSCQLAG